MKKILILISVLLLITSNVWAEAYGKWYHGFYNDEFGDKTNNGYVILYGSGDFSNSATSSSELKVSMLLRGGSLEREDILFSLYEYNWDNPPIQYSDNGDYEDGPTKQFRCNVKDNNGNIFSIGLNSILVVRLTPRSSSSLENSC